MVKQIARLHRDCYGFSQRIAMLGQLFVCIVVALVSLAASDSGEFSVAKNEQTHIKKGFSELKKSDYDKNVVPVGNGKFVVTGCRSDSFCPAGQICENNECILGCRTDYDCPIEKACVNSRCIDPCSVQVPCGRNTDCKPIEHRPKCTCQAGFEGNPNDYCREIQSQPTAECLNDSDCQSGQICEAKVCLVGCRRNEDCQDNEACANGRCANPCNHPDVCGIGAECLVDNHIAVCTCPSSLTGDPNIQCFPGELPKDLPVPDLYFKCPCEACLVPSAHNCLEYFLCLDFVATASIKLLALPLKDPVC